jgi:hypothetical protein
MTVQPTGTIIPTPTIPPGADTLTDIATVISSNDPHLAHGGAYETVCGTGVMIGGNYPCLPINMNRGLGNLTWVQGVPGTVFTGLQCYGPMDLAEMQASAMKNNDARVNRTIQDNLIGGFIPISEFEVRTATEAGGLADADAVARCEYTGQAVIHIHPLLAEQWMGKEIIRVGRHLETVMGAMVSLNCWLPVDQIAVTGWLTVLKGASRVLDPYHDVAPPGPNRGAPLNLWYVNVQTPATVFNDCDLAVLITGVSGGGPVVVPTPITVTAVDPVDMSLNNPYVSFTIDGTGFSPTSVATFNDEPIPGTVYYSPTQLTATIIPTNFVSQVGNYVVSVNGSTNGGIMVNVTDDLDPGACSWQQSTMFPEAGTPVGFRFYTSEDQVDLPDEDITTIDFGDGTTALTAPYTRRSGGWIDHTYAAAGTYTLHVEYANGCNTLNYTSLNVAAPAGISASPGSTFPADADYANAGSCSDSHAMTKYTASPPTQWTAGQSITVGAQNCEFYWTATHWAPGSLPSMATVYPGDVFPYNDALLNSSPADLTGLGYVAANAATAWGAMECFGVLGADGVARWKGHWTGTAWDFCPE